MRDMLAVGSVILLALGLGGVAAYMSVDLTPPGLELIRPPKPAVAERIKREETQRTVQAQASGCKYCASVAELAKTFSRRADSARRHASALRAAMPQISDETAQVAGRESELKTAEVAASRAEAAAVVLTSWASRCVGEEMCKAPSPKVTAASCATTGDPRSAAALLVAISVRNAAQACASASCPSVDCTASGALQGDIGQIEHALDDAGGRVSVVAGQTSGALLPVGASTLKGELKRVADEAGYVTKMLPLLLDDSKAKAATNELPKLAPEMVDERAVSAAQLSVVMEQAAAVAETPETDPRREASWRLRSLATNLATLGHEAQGLETQQGVATWEKVADSLGSALLDLARLQALLDRVSAPDANAAGCDGSAASAAQQLREASAMLDLCRMRSACVGHGGKASTVKASTGDLNETFERAKTTAAAMIVNDLGQQTVQVSNATPSLIDDLRAHGVCHRAGELREASAAAPVVAQAVAQAAVPPSMTPPMVGIMAPQDVVAGAAQTALNEPEQVDAAPAADTTVQVALRYSNVIPRRKPRLPLAADPALMQAAAPRHSTSDADAAYQGVVLPQAGGPRSGVAAFGGEGGPQQLTAPPAEALPPPPAQH